MAINKVEYGDDTLIDLTEDTVTPEDVLKGVSFHSADGEQKTGSVVVAPISDSEISDSKVWSSQKTNAELERKITKPSTALQGQILVYNGSAWVAWTNLARNQQFDNTVTDFDTEPGTTQKAIEALKSLVDEKIDDTTTSTSKAWSSSKTSSMLDSWHTNALGEVVEEIIDVGDVGEREIEFSVTLDYCYRLFADSPNGKMVTIKSSKFEKEGTTDSGVDYGKLTYVVNVTEIPTKFRLRKFKL